MNENDEAEERLSRVEMVLENLLKNKLRVAKVLDATGRIMNDHELRMVEFDREMAESRNKFNREMAESSEKFDREMAESREDFPYRLSALIDVQMSWDSDYLKMKNEVAELRQKVSKLENGAS